MLLFYYKAQSGIPGWYLYNFIEIQPSHACIMSARLSVAVINLSLLNYSIFDNTVRYTSSDN